MDDISGLILIKVEVFDMSLFFYGVAPEPWLCARLSMGSSNHSMTGLPRKR